MDWRQIKLFDQWKRDKVEEVQGHAQFPNADRIRQPHKPSQEPLPDLPFFRLDRNKLESEIRNIAKEIVQLLSDDSSTDRELASLQQHAKQVLGLHPLSPTTVALVGQQGEGKSTLLNALLERPRISKTSAGGKACTVFPIRYLYRGDDTCSKDIYDGEVHFMNNIRLREVISEYVKRLKLPEKPDSDDEDGSDFQEDEEAASAAKEFFSLLFGFRNDIDELEELLSSENIESGRLVRRAMQMAQKRIRQAGAVPENTVAFEA